MGNSGGLNSSVMGSEASTSTCCVFLAAPSTSRVEQPGMVDQFVTITLLYIIITSIIMSVQQK